MDDMEQLLWEADTGVEAKKWVGQESSINMQT